MASRPGLAYWQPVVWAMISLFMISWVLPLLLLIRSPMLLLASTNLRRHLRNLNF